MKLSKKTVAIGVSCLALVALVAGAALAGPFGGHFSPERLKQMAAWRLSDLLDDLQANADQRAQLLAIKDRAIDRLLVVHRDHQRDKQELLDELLKDQPDPDRLHKLLDQKLDSLRPELHEGLDLLLEAQATLSPKQRVELKRLIEERHARRGFFGHH